MCIALRVSIYITAFLWVGRFLGVEYTHNFTIYLPQFLLVFCCIFILIFSDILERKYESGVPLNHCEQGYLDSQKAMKSWVSATFSLFKIVLLPLLCMALVWLVIGGASGLMHSWVS